MFRIFKKKEAEARRISSSAAQVPHMYLVQMCTAEEIARFKVCDGSRLGKDPNADIHIPDMYCACHQCMFFLQDSRWYIRSDSRDTFVNGQWIHEGETAVLPSGSELRFSLMKDTFIFLEPQ